MEFPLLPVVGAYNSLADCFNFAVFRQSEKHVVIRFGEYDVVKNHSGIEDFIRRELVAAAKIDTYLDVYDAFSRMGGGMVRSINLPGSINYIAPQPSYCLITGQSSVFGKADFTLVRQLLIETKTFDKVRFG